MTYLNTVKERFMAKVDTTSSPIGCWIWNASTRSNGYGKFRVKGMYWGAHRFSFFMFIGPVPHDLFVCHSCDNKSCVNPDHLWLGSNKDNLDDAVRKGLHGKNLKRGETQHASIFTDADVLIMRRLANKNFTHGQIADLFDVERRCVSKVISRTTWKHVA